MAGKKTEIGISRALFVALEVAGLKRNHRLDPLYLGVTVHLILATP